MKIFNKQNELMKKSIELRKLDLRGVDFKKAEEIRKQQNECYNKMLFYKNIAENLRKVGGENNVGVDQR